MVDESNFSLYERLSIAAASIMLEDKERKYELVDKEDGFYVLRSYRHADSRDFHEISSAYFQGNRRISGSEKLELELEEKFYDFFNKYLLR